MKLTFVKFLFVFAEELEKYIDDDALIQFIYDYYLESEGGDVFTVGLAVADHNYIVSQVDNAIRDSIQYPVHSLYY